MSVFFEFEIGSLDPDLDLAASPELTSEHRDLHLTAKTVMFYSEVILARKGPLGKIWLAAHFDKKLTRNQIFATDISSSVESVLNPASPLALRVSGHLMLGIVRIYSRKVSYLMTECKEAMWKINLAFRPGTFDIDPSLATALNIHDARHFGNITMENEIPDLENAEFPQMFLPEQDHFGFDSTQMSDSSYFGSGHGMQDYSLSADSPAARSQTRLSRTHSDSASRHSHVSDLELTRFERAGSLLSQQRASMSATKAGRPSGLSMQMGYEDDIPAFEPQGFDLDPMAPAEMLDFGADNYNYAPEYNEEALPAEESKGGADSASSRRGSRASARMQELQEAREAALRREQERVESEEEEEEADEEVRVARGTKAQAQAGGEAGGEARKKRRVAKRRRVMIDDRVELPSRLLKQRMDDLAPILRQRGVGGTGGASSSSAPTGVRGLCSELQEVFNMSINEAPLPFPLREDVAAAASTAAAGSAARGSARQSVESAAEEPQYYADDLELTRAPRESELSAIGGRPSTLNASSIMGKEGDSFAMDEGATRFSQGSRMRDSYADGGDFGFGEDYAAPFDEPLAFRDSSPGPGTAAEESKRGSGAGSASQRVFAKRPTLTATNAISELVASTFSRSAAEQDRDSKDASSGGESHHTRTEQFMEILVGEFATKPSVSFDGVTSGVSKRVAAAAFLEVLQLKTWGRIAVQQPAPFADIQLAPQTLGSL